MVESDAGAVVSVTAEVWLWSLLLLDFDGDNLDLVVTQTNFDLELVGHNELISLNGVVVVLLLRLLLLLVVVSLVLLLWLLLIIIHVLLHL